MLLTPVAAVARRAVSLSRLSTHRPILSHLARPSALFAHGLRRSESFASSIRPLERRPIGTSPPDALPSPIFREGRILVDGMSFSPVHLRDHCRSPESFHPVTHQRLLDTVSLPEDLYPMDLRLEDGVLHVVWSHDGHRSAYPLLFLRSIAPSPTGLVRNDIIPASKTLWTDPSYYAAQQPSVEHDEIMSSDTSSSAAARLTALEHLQAHGVVFVHSVPPSPAGTESVLRTLVGQRPLRETHYAPLWEFEADMAHGDLAYSNHALGAHTDGSYFEDPPGVQAFHLMAHPSPGVGGESLLVDGFTAADRLRTSYPEAYDVLTRLKTPAVAAGTPTVLYHTAQGFPVFHHGSDGTLESVRWNVEDRARFGKGWAQDEVNRWYAAARVWEGLLRRDDARVWLKLKPGTVVVIDNHRVLHGRAAFTGYRKMCGAYIGKDEWRSELAVLRRRRAIEGGEKKGVYDVEY